MRKALRRKYCERNFVWEIVEKKFGEGTFVKEILRGKRADMDEESRIVREIAKGLFRWYEFREESRVLYIGKPEDGLAELFRERGLSVVCREPLESMDEAWAAENRGCGEAGGGRESCQLFKGMERTVKSGRAASAGNE